MSRVRADQLINRAADGAPTATSGLQVTGVCTATSFAGALTGNVTGTSTGLSGTPDLAIGNLQVGIITSTGNVTVGGTLTYEDVTNIDSVGIVTARTGVRVTAGGVEVTAGGLTITAGESYFGGGLSEKATVVANKLSAAANIDVSTGNVWYFSTNETGTGTPNLRWDGSTTLGSKLATGDSVAVSIISKPNGAGYYAQMTIDGVAQTEEWNGGSAPSSANAGGYDVTTYQILKTGSGTTDYIVLANVSNFA